MTGSRRFLVILWPAFLAACGLEFLVFGLFDPAELHWRGAPIEWPRNAVYSIGFVLFWASAASASFLTLVLAAPDDNARRVNGEAA